MRSMLQGSRAMDAVCLSPGHHAWPVRICRGCEILEFHAAQDACDMPLPSTGASCMELGDPEKL